MQIHKLLFKHKNSGWGKKESKIQLNISSKKYLPNMTKKI